MLRHLRTVLFPVVLAVLFVSEGPAAAAPGNANGSKLQENTGLTSTQVRNRTGNFVMKVFDLDFVDYSQDLKAMRPMFTRKGHEEFVKALQEAGQIETIENMKVVLTPTIMGQPEIKKTGQIDGRKAWQVSVPIELAYQNTKSVDRQQLDVMVKVVRAPKKPYGIAIAQLIAK